MSARPISTRDPSKVSRIWMDIGGSVAPVRRTGEIRYTHPLFASPLTVNGRRQDVPAKLISRVNQIIKSQI